MKRKIILLSRVLILIGLITSCSSNLSEKNIEMIIEDEKKYEKKSNIKLNFFD